MHAILFDIDGTLLNTSGAGQDAMMAAVAREFGPVGPVTDIPFAGRTDRAIMGDILAHCDIVPTDEARQRFREAYLAALPGELDRHPGLVLPGVVQMLSHLHGREDVTLGLLTGNLLKGAELKLGHFGLESYFDFAVGAFGDEHEDRDDLARRAWDILQNLPDVGATLTPSQVWVVGDTPADIQCARAIGARVLAVATGWYRKSQLIEGEPDIVLDRFEDVERLLERWIGDPPAA